MTLNQLKIFAAVAKHLNISRASRELRVSQPAVSQQLKFLKEELGVSLYKKTGRGIELTQIGRSLLTKITLILGEIGKLSRAFPASPASLVRTETLTVGGSYGTSVSLLPSSMTAFKKAHPNLHLELRTASKHTMERLVLGGEVDIGVVTSSPRSPRLFVEPYRKEPIVVFAARNYPLVKKGELSIVEFARLPLVLRGGGRRKSVVENRLRQAGQGLTANIIMRCESPDAVKIAVRQKLGIGVLHHDLVRREVQNGEYKILPIKGLALYGRSYIIYDRGRPLSPVAKDFLGLLRRNRSKKIPNDISYRSKDDPSSGVARLPTNG